MGIASSDKNTIRKMSEIEAVIYDRFLQKSPPTRRLIPRDSLTSGQSTTTTDDQMRNHIILKIPNHEK